MRREIDILYNYWEENRIITADMRKDDKNITQIIRKGSDNEVICEAVNDYVGRKMKDSFMAGFCMAAGVFIDIANNTNEVENEKR